MRDTRFPAISLALLMVLVLIANVAFAQQVNISAQLLNPGLRIFFLSDFNLTGKGTSSGDIFSIMMSNSSLAPVPCYLVLTIRSDAMGELASGQTQPFTLNPAQPIRLTNQNLFTEAQQFRLQDYSIEGAGNELKNRLLATGKLPSDTYYFLFDLHQLNSSHVSHAEISIRVDNPSTLTLISPGSPAGREEPMPVYTLLPLFRWDSNLDKFRLRIAEKLPDVHAGASPEEVMRDRVRFDRTFRIDRALANGIDVLATTAYQYPASGVWPLERGKTYYWQITGLAATSGAEVELPGEIWAFKLVDFSSSGEGAPSFLLSELGGLLGDQLAALLTASGPLNGFTPTGVFTINGRPYSLDQVLSLLAKIKNGEYTIVNVSCE